MTPTSRLAPLRPLVGHWTTEATHPAMPEAVVRGTAVVEWLEGERFLIHRARNEHPDFPDAISILGQMGPDRVGVVQGADALPLHVHYFDSRGVFRVYEADADEAAWRLWRDAPEFSQRFTGRWSEDYSAIDGLWQLSRDGVLWADDLRIMYRREA